MIDNCSSYSFMLQKNTPLCHIHIITVHLYVLDYWAIRIQYFKLESMSTLVQITLVLSNLSLLQNTLSLKTERKKTNLQWITLGTQDFFWSRSQWVVCHEYSPFGVRTINQLPHPSIGLGWHGSINVV